MILSNFTRFLGNFTEFYWLFTWFYVFLPSLTQFYWVLPNFVQFYWVFTDKNWVLQGSTECYLVFPDFIRFSHLVWQSFYSVLFLSKSFFFSNSNVISWNAGLNGKTRKWYSKKKTKWREMKIKQNEIVFLFFYFPFFLKKNDARDAIRREMFISADRNRWLPSFVLELPSYFLILFVFVSFFPFRFVIVFIRLFLFLLSFAPLLLGIFHRFLFSFRFFFNFVFFFCVCVCVCVLKLKRKKKEGRFCFPSLLMTGHPNSPSSERNSVKRKEWRSWKIIDAIKFTRGSHEKLSSPEKNPTNYSTILKKPNKTYRDTVKPSKTQYNKCKPSKAYWNIIKPSKTQYNLEETCKTQ